MEIVFESGPRRGARFPLGEGTHTLGRDSDNSCIVRGRGVSRKHVQLVVTGDSIALQDLGSSNGTWVNGLRCTRAALGWGDRVRLGGVLLRLVQPGETAQAPLPPAAAREFLLGDAPAFVAAAERAVALAAQRGPLWIEGPPGSGRLSLAQAIHRLSARKYGPFAVVDLRGQPEERQADDILGSGERMGLAPLCERGTLVLRAAEQLAEPVARQLVELAPRLPRLRICALSTPGIAGVSPLSALGPELLSLPGLAERSGDIVPLASHFLALARPGAGLADCCKLALIERAWPENVRELRDVIERAARRLTGDLLEAAQLVDAPVQEDEDERVIVPDAIVQGDLEAPILPIAEVIDRAVRRALIICKDDRKLAADFLKISRKELAEHIQRLKAQQSAAEEAAPE